MRADIPAGQAAGTNRGCVLHRGNRQTGILNCNMIPQEKARKGS